VEADARNLGGLDELLVLSDEAIDVQWTTGVVGEDESLILPQWTQAKAFRILGCAVLPKCVHARTRKGN
jgi:hypothetical protein